METLQYSFRGDELLAHAISSHIGPTVRLVDSLEQIYTAQVFDRRYMNIGYYTRAEAYGPDDPNLPLDLAVNVDLQDGLTLPRFPGHLVKIHCRSRISGCGSCWQRGALSKRRWKSGVDFHGRVSFHS